MNLAMDPVRTTLSIVLIVFSFITAFVASKYKGSKKEFLNFIYDVIIMIAGGLFVMGTFGIIFHLLLVKVKSFLAFYELAKLSNAEVHTYKRPLVRLIWISIFGEMLSFISEVTKLLP